MRAAIEEARKGQQAGDYAIGAAIVKDGNILYQCGNRAKIEQDSTQHAEMVAIRGISKILKSRFLPGCVLYTTHEPCPMCAAAAVWARMDGVVFGSTLEDMIEYRQANGNKKWTWRTIDVPAKEVISKGTPTLELVEKFMREECKKLFHSV